MSAPRLGWKLAALIFCLTGTIIENAPRAQAQDFVVNSTGDGTDVNPGDGICSTGNSLPSQPGVTECTLRAAIVEANNRAGAHKIAVPAGTYNLTNSYPCPASSGGVHLHYCMTGQMNIVGAGAGQTILDGGQIDRVIFVGATGNVQVSGVTVQNGFQQGGNFDSGGGGGIANLGRLTVSDSVVTNDRSFVGGGGFYNGGNLTIRRVTVSNCSGGTQGGGGLDNNGGTLTIADSTFLLNTSHNGGALWNLSGPTSITGTTFMQNTSTDFDSAAVALYQFNDPFRITTTITNSTIAANNGYGMFIGNSMTAVMNNVTIAGNTAGGIFTQVFSTNSFVKLQNSIVAGNPNGSGADLACNPSAPYTSLEHNLIQNRGGCIITGDTATNIFGKDPLLGLLTDNGGATQTMALAATSPALNAGNPSDPGSGNGACAAVDQRAVNRPQGAACDIGAFESQGGFAVTGVSPNQAGNGGLKFLLINGTGFSLSSVPTLKCGAAMLTGSSVGVDSAGSVLTASFDLTNVAPASCDVAVSNPAGPSATLAAGLTVVAPSAPNLWSNIGTRRAVRVGMPNTFRLFYGNLGNTDAYGVAFGLYLTTNIAAQLQIKVAPPIAQTGDVAVDWTYVPIKELATTPGYNFVPLLLPVVPAGFTGEVDITVSAPTALHGQSFTIATSIGPATESAAQVVSPVLMTDLVSGAKQYATKYLNGTISAASDTALSNYYTAEIQQIVAGSRNALGKNLLQQGPVYSLAQIQDAGASNILQLPPHYVGGSGNGTGTGTGNGNGSGVPGDGGGGAGSGSGDDSGDDDCGWIGWCDPTPPPPSPCDKWPPNACGGSSPNGGPLVDSLDPNDKTGPSGAGAARFINGATPLNYTIQFENQATATAPAQKVVVTDNLDGTKVNLSTLSLGPISFGSRTIVPSPGLQQFTQDVDLRPAQNLLARVVGKLDAATGIATWTFSSIDPLTLEATQDPLAGFLPPDTTPPTGEGSVSFTVSAVPTLATGTTICNQGVVVFDSNAAINTPTWCNGIDKTTPVSAVAALAGTQTATTFAVSWTGVDADSGIGAFNIYVSENGGPFTAWLKGTTATTGSFTGQVGHSYGFVSQAVDNVGNVEATRSIADATTSVINAATAPTITANPVNASANAGASVSFTAAATGSPAPTVQWQVSTDGAVTFSDVTGGTASTLTFTTAIGDNGKFYRAVFTNTASSATSSAAKLTVTALVGDVNVDGVVNCVDIAIVKASFGKKNGQVGFDPRADVNKDGVVNVVDLAIASKQLPQGTTCN
jgi:CSLREA domain-containing protein